MVRILTLIWETSRSIICQIHLYKAFVSTLYENIQKCLVSYLFVCSLPVVRSTKGHIWLLHWGKMDSSSHLCQFLCILTFKIISLSSQATAVLLKCVFSIKKRCCTDVLNYIGFVRIVYFKSKDSVAQWVINERL